MRLRFLTLRVAGNYTVSRRGRLFLREVPHRERTNSDPSQDAAHDADNAADVRPSLVLAVGPGEASFAVAGEATVVHGAIDGDAVVAALAVGAVGRRLRVVATAAAAAALACELSNGM